jgi:hypothetical protein
MIGALPVRPPVPAPMVDVRPEHLGLLQTAIWPLLERAAGAYRGDSALELLTRCASRRAQLWLWWEDGGARALAITEVVPRPSTGPGRGWAGRVKAIAGDGLGTWLAPGLAVLEGWAREQDAGHMQVLGRAGWARRLRAHGYRATAGGIIEKELWHG